MNEIDITRALTRIAHEILEHNQGSSNLLILGIPTGGAHLAKRIAQLISKIEGVVLEAGTLDVTLHRDDLRMRAPRALMPTYIPSGNSASIINSGVEGRDVVLIDDVLFSGRTIRAALDALGELGRPKTVQLAVLIDRGHRELPIRADYVGKNIPTNHNQSVKVLFSEVDGRDEVILG